MLHEEHTLSTILDLVRRDIPGPILIQTYSCLQEKVLLGKLTSARESLVERSEAVRGAALGLTLAPVEKKGMEECYCHHKSENGNVVSSSLAFIG